MFAVKCLSFCLSSIEFWQRQISFYTTDCLWEASCGLWCNSMSDLFS